MRTASTRDRGPLRATGHTFDGQVSGFGIGTKFGGTVRVARDGTYGVTATKVVGVLRLDITRDDGTTCTSGRVTYTLR